MTSTMANVVLLGLSLFASRVLAHEHHGDAVPEGEGVTADPIVRFSPLFPS